MIMKNNSHVHHMHNRVFPRAALRYDSERKPAGSDEFAKLILEQYRTIQQGLVVNNLEEL